MAESEKLHPHEFYIAELAYHRERIASIFAWASGLLFTSLGGNVLVSKLLENHPSASGATPQPEKFRDPLLVIPVIIITIFAMLWMYHHAAEAHANKLLLQELDQVNTKFSSRETAFAHIGSAVLTLLGVGIAVSVLIVFSP